ncbi:hypothetical protein ACX2VI_004282 [Cronobacter dublinensis]
MENKITIDDESVYHVYQTDPKPQYTGYNIFLYSKKHADEKEIAEVEFFWNRSKKRLGWIFPVLALISGEHDYADNEFFIKQAYEAYTHLKGQVLDENIYIFVLNNTVSDLLEVGKEKLGVFSLSFSKYGIYPYFSSLAEYSNSNALDIPNKLTIKKCFNLAEEKKTYIHVLVKKIIIEEKNEYARFMFFYQVYELSMELFFYKQLETFKRNKKRLATLKDKLSEFSSERKLINAMYEIMGDKYDIALSNISKSIFGAINEESYYNGEMKSNMIYDLRNALVHNYFRYNFTDNLKNLSDYLEMEIYDILQFLYDDEYLREVFIDEYL